MRGAMHDGCDEVGQTRTTGASPRRYHGTGDVAKSGTRDLAEFYIHRPGTVRPQVYAGHGRGIPKISTGEKIFNERYLTLPISDNDAKRELSVVSGVPT